MKIPLTSMMKSNRIEREPTTLTVFRHRQAVEKNKLKFNTEPTRALNRAMILPIT